MPRSRLVRILVLPGATLALIAWASVQWGMGAPAVKPAANPHWKPDHCGHCHAMDGNRPQPFDREAVQAGCLKCHDGKSAAAEMHPLNRPIPRDRMDFPADWPLSNGKLTCLTCHDVKRACSKEVRRDYSNPTMLRIIPVGHQEKPFCQSCHRPSELPKLNPHIMLTADRQPIESQCLICHTRPMDRTATARTGNPMLRAKEIQFCKSCHPRHKEQFSPGHIGHPIKPEMLAFMKSREMIGLAVSPSRPLVEELKKVKARPGLMSVAADNTVTCSTCHNPHQSGTFNVTAPMAYRPMKIVDGKTTSPVRGEQWCNHCHDMN